LDEPNVDEEGDFDVLLWWKQICLTYPVISIMARDVFATPVSTVASESAFSTGGRILDSFRSWLSPEMAEALLSINSKIKISKKILMHLKRLLEVMYYI
jgi:hypothetical protein